MSLCDNPVLIDEGTMSFSLDKWTGKKCYMIAPKGLRIAWGDDPIYWQWISLPNTVTRFGEVPELHWLGWFEIRGRIEIHMLSPSTTYKAYLVYKFSKRARGFERNPVVIGFSLRENGFDYECPPLSEMLAKGELYRTAILAHGPKWKIPDKVRNDQNEVPSERDDGWLEMKLGEFYCQGGEDGELEMTCCELDGCKSGIIVLGIEIRP